MFHRWGNAILWVLFIIYLGCATPSQPTGGPPDEEGPTIIRSEPETGTVNFEGNSIILHFSEFVDRGSLNQALVIEPDIGLEYDLDWGRKSVEIQFDRELPDTTTLIVTVGTEFQDMNNNEMAQPRKIAVSTGPEIDEGKIFGRVVNAETGEVEDGQRVLLYREPFDLQEKADYIASTDTSGAFQFSYLSDGIYKAIWVEDRNRNKIWEPEQERAQPFSREFIKLEKAAEDTIGTVYSVSEDTTKPALQGIGLFSSQRMRMRFSENMQLTDTTEIIVADTLGNPHSNAIPLYIQPNDKFIFFAHSEEPLTEEESYTLDIIGLTDEAGNTLVETTQTFTGSAQEDTTNQRIIKRNTTSGYYPTDPIAITYAKPIEENAIIDSLKIVEGDSLIEDWPNTEIHYNVLNILPDKQWREGANYEVRTWDPQVEDYRQFQPEIWHDSQMGSLNIMLEDSTMENVYLRIENDESDFVRDTTFAGEVEVTNLPPLNYKVIAYHDHNENGRWDYGEIEPFTEPEPYFIQRRVPVKTDFTGDLTIDFQD